MNKHYQIIESSSIKELKPRNIYDNWNHRLLYESDENSKLWIQYCKKYSTELLNKGEFIKDIEEICRPIRDIRIDMFVSLGPGDGNKDIGILQKLNNPSINYIPVDISSFFLKRFSSISSENFNSPLGIHADFETDFRFIAKVVNRYGTGNKIFSLLGNTFGTLDKYENSFINEFITYVGSEDYLLIEVGILKNSWQFNTDVSSMSLFNDKSFKKMVANNVSIKSGDNVETIVANFNTRVDVRKGESDVSGAIVYEFFDTKTKLKVFCLTRYNWGELVKWFRVNQNAFELVYHYSYFYEDINLGTGIILLKNNI